MYHVLLYTISELLCASVSKQVKGKTIHMKTTDLHENEPVRRRKVFHLNSF